MCHFIDRDIKVSADVKVVKREAFAKILSTAIINFLQGRQEMAGMEEGEAVMYWVSLTKQCDMIMNMNSRIQ